MSMDLIYYAYATCTVCGGIVTNSAGWAAHDHPQQPAILLRDDEASVERLTAALEREGFVRGVAGRYGKFNATYWSESARAIIEALRG